MKYRKLGSTGIEVSEIGLGLEHLLDKDENIVIDTIKIAINGGINYFDCLSPNNSAGRFDNVDGFKKLGKAIEGVREKIYLTFLANSPLSVADVQLGFDGFLKELNTSYADVFIIACCDKMIDFEGVTGEDSLLEYAKKLRTEEKVRYVGLSTHNTEIAYKVINSGQFDILMYPINPAFDVIADEEKFNSDILGNIWDAAFNYTSTDKNGILPRRNVYNECERNNIGLVAMKPFAGGFILEVEKDAGFTPINLVSYVLAQKGVSTVIPGCSNPQEIKDILTYYTSSKKALDYSEAVAKSRWSAKSNCLYCNHCMPCSANIDITEINKLLDGFNSSGTSNADIQQKKYDTFSVKASSCIRCGECEKRCPFKVNIIKKMDQAIAIFEGTKI